MNRYAIIFTICIEDQQRSWQKIRRTTQAFNKWHNKVGLNTVTLLNHLMTFTILDWEPCFYLALYSLSTCSWLACKQELWSQANTLYCTITIATTLHTRQCPINILSFKKIVLVVRTHSITEGNEILWYF